MLKLKNIKLSEDLDQRYLKKEDVDSEINQFSTNPPQNQAVYSYIRKFAKDGYISQQRQCVISGDTIEEDGGFYSICGAKNGLILGCKCKNPFFYELSTDTFIESELTGISDSPTIHGAILSDEQNDFSYKTIPLSDIPLGLRTKYILNDSTDSEQKHVIWTSYADKSSKTVESQRKLGKVYSTSDGKKWKLESKISANTRFDLYQNITKCNGRYYVANGRKMMYSDDLKNWESSSTDAPFDIYHIEANGNMVFCCGNGRITGFNTSTGQFTSLNIALNGALLSAIAASSYSDERFVIFGFSKGYIVYSVNDFETYSEYTLGTDVGDIRAIAKKDNVYYIAGYTNKKIYYSIDVTNWSELASSDDYPRTEGLVEHEDELWYATRRDPESKNVEPTVFRMTVLNDKILKSMLMQTQTEDVRNLKASMKNALSSAFHGKNSPEEVDQIAVNSALSSIYDFLKI